MQALKSSSKVLRFAQTILLLGLFLLGMGGILGRVQPARAASSAITVSDLKAEYIFGEAMIFSAQVHSDTPIEKVQLLFHPGNNETITGQATLDESGLAVYTHDLVNQPVRSFIEIEYWFQVTLKNGETAQSDPATFYYEDSRFEWQSRDTGTFRVLWYEGDDSFGQSLLDTAQAGLERAQSLLPITPTMPVKIYVYATPLEMQSTLQLGRISWVRGHAAPDLGVMVVSLPRGPDQRMEMERQIPHELMHILLYQWMGERYNNLPVWLNEGLASLAEINPNPDYTTMLNLANKKGSLLALDSLCTTLPVDASGAFLAYAEADGFTRFLLGQFGREGMKTLVSAYTQGIGCERGVEVGLGQRLDSLESQWLRKTFGVSSIARAVANFLPWLGLLLAALAVPLLAAVVGFIPRRLPPTSTSPTLPAKPGTRPPKGTGR